MGNHSLASMVPGAGPRDKGRYECTCGNVSPGIKAFREHRRMAYRLISISNGAEVVARQLYQRPYASLPLGEKKYCEALATDILDAMHNFKD